MTRVDLDAVLKLQRDYTTLEERLNRLAEYALARENGHETYFMVGNDILDAVARIIDGMANRIKKLEDGTDIHED